MENIIDIAINTEYIKLNSLLKLAHVVTQGSEAKIITLEGMVSMDDGVITEIRKKIYPGMSVCVNYNNEITVINVSKG